jgi:hypothetical protein
MEHSHNSRNDGTPSVIARPIIAAPGFPALPPLKRGAFAQIPASSCGNPAKANSWRTQMIIFREILIDHAAIRNRCK